MQSFLEFLLYSSLLLLFGGCVVTLLLRFTGCQSLKWNRFAWAFVLLLGVAAVRLPVEIAVLPTEPAALAREEQSRNRQIAESSAPLVAQGLPNSAPLYPYGENDKGIRAQDESKPGLLRAHVPMENFLVEDEATQRAVGVSPPVLERITSNSPGGLRPTARAFFAAWLCGAILFFTVQLFLYYRAIRQTKNVTLPDEKFQTEWNRLLTLYGITDRNIELRTAEGLGPGLWRLPTKSLVIVPSALWEEAPEHVRLNILKHELSHYRHHDLIKSLALRTMTLLHWFNPMAHYATKKFDEAAEWRCDADAFGTTENAESNFAETMLLFRDTVPAIAVCRTAFCGNNIKSRAERLIQFIQHKGDSIMKKMLIVLCCAALLLFGLFEFKLVAQQKEPGTEQSEVPGLSSVLDKKRVNVSARVLMPNGEVADGINWRVVGHIIALWTQSPGGKTEVHGEFTTDVPANEPCVVAVFDSQNCYAAPMQIITIGDESPQDELVFQFQEGVPLTATFVDETTGTAIPGLRVRLMQEPKIVPNKTVWVSFEMPSSEPGRFQACVVPGEYVVAIDSLYTNKDVIQKGVYARKFTVESGKPVSLEFKIPSSFVGKVLNIDGTPAVGRHVRVASIERRSLFSTSQKIFTQAITDEKGQFRCVFKPVDAAVSVWGSTSRREGQYIGWFANELANAEEYTFQLVADTEVQGRLLDAKTKEPIERQLVWIRQKNPNNPAQETDPPSSAGLTDKGYFSTRLNPTVLNDLFVGFGSKPQVNIMTLGPEQLKGKNVLDLGDIFVDFEKAMVQRAGDGGTPQSPDVNVANPATARSTAPSPALSIDSDYIALLEKRVEVARMRFEATKSDADAGIGTRTEQAEAELALLEAEYALKKAKEPGTEQSAVPGLATLQAERQRLVAQAQTLQENIRQKTKEAAMASGMENGESLKRDVALEETKLTAMQARHTAAKDRLKNPGQIPRALIEQMDPELAKLNTEKQALQLQRDSIAERIAKPESDPRIIQFDKRIKEIDDKIKIASDPNESRRQAVMDAFRAQEELNIFTLGQEIRAQEILVEELRKKYNEQLEEHVKRATDMIDAKFDQTQLDRTNKTLEQIDQRILLLQSAPQRAEDGGTP